MGFANIPAEQHEVEKAYLVDPLIPFLPFPTFSTGHAWIWKRD